MVWGRSPQHEGLHLMVVALGRLRIGVLDRAGSPGRLLPSLPSQGDEQKPGFQVLVFHTTLSRHKDSGWALNNPFVYRGSFPAAGSHPQSHAQFPRRGTGLLTEKQK